MLGATDWGSIANAGADIFTSIYGWEQEKKAMASQAKNVQLELEARKQRGEQITKLVLIGGGIIVATGITIAIIKALK